MRVAVFGATSAIASDLIRYLAKRHVSLDLYSRRADLSHGFYGLGATYDIRPFLYEDLSDADKYDCLINFVGLGCPKKIEEKGEELIPVADHYDRLASSYIHSNPSCRYIFISSGVAYGEHFHQCIPEDGRVIDYELEIPRSSVYAVSKMICEQRHRSMEHFAVVDLRVFSYFSENYTHETHTFMGQIMSALRRNELLTVTPQPMIRDYIHPYDFCRLVELIMKGPLENAAVDCFSRRCVDKFTLLEAFHSKFGLKYKIDDRDVPEISPPKKINYYSLYRKATELGYEPTYSSLDGLLDVCDRSLGFS